MKEVHIIGTNINYKLMSFSLQMCKFNIKYFYIVFLYFYIIMIIFTYFTSYLILILMIFAILKKYIL